MHLSINYNSGSNQGLIVGENKGNIEVSIKNAVRIPSLISAVVKSLGEVCSSDDIESTFDSKEFKPDEKIEYNHVIKYKDIIRYFSAYYSICEGYLNAYDDSNMRGKAKILNCVYSWYMKERGTILLENKDFGKEDIDIIRQNSDKIIDMVQDKIFETVKAANEIDIMYIEDFEDSKRRYGAVKLCRVLNVAGTPCSIKRVQRHMAGQGLRPVAGKKYSHHANHGSIPDDKVNILERDFRTETINQKWCTDITYWYNRKRIHSSIGYLTPQQKEDEELKKEA